MQTLLAHRSSTDIIGAKGSEQTTSPERLREISPLRNFAPDVAALTIAGSPLLAEMRRRSRAYTNVDAANLFVALNGGEDSSRPVSPSQRALSPRIFTRQNNTSPPLVSPPPFRRQSPSTTDSMDGLDECSSASGSSIPSLSSGTPLLTRRTELSSSSSSDDEISEIASLHRSSTPIIRAPKKFQRPRRRSIRLPASELVSPAPVVTTHDKLEVSSDYDSSPTNSPRLSARSHAQEPPQHRRLSRSISPRALGTRRSRDLTSFVESIQGECEIVSTSALQTMVLPAKATKTSEAIKLSSLITGDKPLILVLLRYHSTKYERSICHTFDSPFHFFFFFY